MAHHGPHPHHSPHRLTSIASDNLRRAIQTKSRSVATSRCRPSVTTPPSLPGGNNCITKPTSATATNHNNNQERSSRAGSPCGCALCQRVATWVSSQASSQAESCREPTPTPPCWTSGEDDAHGELPKTKHIKPTHKTTGGAGDVGRTPAAPRNRMTAGGSSVRVEMPTTPADAATTTKRKRAATEDAEVHPEPAATARPRVPGTTTTTTASLPPKKVRLDTEDTPAAYSKTSVLSSTLDGPSPATSQNSPDRAPTRTSLAFDLDLHSENQEAAKQALATAMAGIPAASDSDIGMDESGCTEYTDDDVSASCFCDCCTENTSLPSDHPMALDHFSIFPHHMLCIDAWSYAEGLSADDGYSTSYHEWYGSEGEPEGLLKPLRNRDTEEGGGEAQTNKALGEEGGESELLSDDGMEEDEEESEEDSEGESNEGSISSDSDESDDSSNSDSSVSSSDVSSDSSDSRDDDGDTVMKEEEKTNAAEFTAALGVVQKKVVGGTKQPRVIWPNKHTVAFAPKNTEVAVATKKTPATAKKNAAVGDLMWSRAPGISARQTETEEAPKVTETARKWTEESKSTPAVVTTKKTDAAVATKKTDAAVATKKTGGAVAAKNPDAAVVTTKKTDAAVVATPAATVPALAEPITTIAAAPTGQSVPTPNASVHDNEEASPEDTVPPILFNMTDSLNSWHDATTALLGDIKMSEERFSVTATQHDVKLMAMEAHIKQVEEEAATKVKIARDKLAHLSALQKVRASRHNRSVSVLRNQVAALKAEFQASVEKAYTMMLEAGSGEEKEKEKKKEQQ